MSKESSKSKQIRFIRKTLENEFQKVPQLPEIVGNKTIIRFLSANNDNVNSACLAIHNHLEWSVAVGFEHIRNEILNRELSTPHSFPCGKKILRVIPQLLVVFKGIDKNGLPILSDSYGYSSKLSATSISLEEYLLFIRYVIVYKVLVLEQLSFEMSSVLRAIPSKELPGCFGGTSTTSFEFDTSDTGPFHCPGDDQISDTMTVCSDTTSTSIVSTSNAFRSLFVRESSLSSIISTSSTSSNSNVVTGKSTEQEKSEQPRSLLTSLFYSSDANNGKEKNASDTNDRAPVRRVSSPSCKAVQWNDELPPRETAETKGRSSMSSSSSSAGGVAFTQKAIRANGDVYRNVLVGELVPGDVVYETV